MSTPLSTESPTRVANFIRLVISLLDDDDALHALARLFHREELDSKLRRAALKMLCQHQSPIAVELLQQLAADHGPLADEARAELKMRRFS